jgi:hypothetical protein
MPLLPSSPYIPTVPLEELPAVVTNPPGDFNVTELTVDAPISERISKPTLLPSSILR